MSSFLKALAKVGLVELDEKDKAKMGASSARAPSAQPESSDDIERILRETQAAIEATQDPAPRAEKATAKPAPTPTPAAAPPPRREAPPPPAEGGSTPIAEGRPLEELYAAAGVPVMAFTAEKLLKVLEGLKAMPTATRRAAVQAMDDADDDWSISDVILDAQRKSRALREAAAQLQQQVSAAEASAAAELADQDSYEQQATAAIRQQIAELEATLQQEIQQVEAQKATIRAQLQAAREAAAREAARLEAEVARIAQIPLTFGDSEDSANPNRG